MAGKGQASSIQAVASTTLVYLLVVYSGLRRACIISIVMLRWELSSLMVCVLKTCNGIREVRSKPKR